MKKILLSSLVAAAAAVPALAGVNNLNYQAVIKNGSNVVASEKVELKFELLDNNEVVYTEEQAPTTNAAGFVSCQLGNEEAFSTIEWGDLTLRVSINLGNGYEVISNEAVSSVPTALYALRSADSDMIKEAVEGLLEDTELNKETILDINAEIVRLNGMTEEFATIEQVDDFATMLETRIDKMQNQMDEADKTIEENYDDLKGSVMRAEQNIAALQGKQNEDIEALSEQTDAFATMTETRIDKVQGQVDALDADIENIKENLTNAFEAKDAEIAEINGQIENLNNVSAVVRANEEAIEELQGDFKNIGENLDNSFAEMSAKFEEVEGKIENLTNFATVVKEEYASNEDVEAAFDRLQPVLDKMQKQLDLIDPEVENLVQDVEDVKTNVRSISADVAQIEGLAEKVEALEEAAAENENLKKQINDLQDELDSLREGIYGIMQTVNELHPGTFDLPTTGPLK